MRASPFLVVILALAIAAPAALGGSQSVNGTARGTVAVSQWVIYNYWVNATGWSNLTLSWTLLTQAEDLSFTLYKPGAWDAQCPPQASQCAFVQRSQDIYAQSFGCPPLHASEGLRIKDLPAGRYHLVVEGNVGWDVPFTLSTDRGEFTRNGTSLLAVQAYVPPC